MSVTGELIVTAPLRVVERGSAVRMTKKLITGLERYVQFWQGPVRVILPPAPDERESGNLDDVFRERSELSFAVDVLPFGTAAMRDRLRGASIVLGGADHRLSGTAAFCRGIGVPYVMTTEYSLATRWQIARTAGLHPIRLARTMLWEWQLERKHVAEVQASTGIQCNGTPTFDAYAKWSPNALLYFDTRTEQEMLASESDIVRKAQRRAEGGPLRLCFSGRLTPMKGADDLVPVARELSRLGVDFTLDVCGAGTSEALMRRQVEDWDLGEKVRFRGVLDFDRELMPFVREQIDLFVCCHKQGDPSCTYLETFACGVPIAGYDNEAFAGLLRLVGAGFASPLGDPRALAGLIAELRRPEEEERIAAAARHALAFATQHTFHSTFRRRIEHLQALVRAEREPVEAPAYGESSPTMG